MSLLSMPGERHHVLVGNEADARSVLILRRVLGLSTRDYLAFV